MSHHCGCTLPGDMHEALHGGEPGGVVKHPPGTGDDVKAHEIHDCQRTEEVLWETREARDALEQRLGVAEEALEEWSKVLPIATANYPMRSTAASTLEWLREHFIEDIATEAELDTLRERLRVAEEEVKRLQDYIENQANEAIRELVGERNGAIAERDTARTAAEEMWKVVKWMERTGDPQALLWAGRFRRNTKERE